MDLTVTLANGGEAITDLALLRDQAGPAASNATAWRLLADLDHTALAALRTARAAAREVTWMQATDTGPGTATAQREVAHRP